MIPSLYRNRAETAPKRAMVHIGKCGFISIGSNIARGGEMVLKNFACFMAAALVLISATTGNAAQVLFTPTLTLSGEYTDNLFLTEDNEEDDYITSAGLGLFGQVLWRTGGIELDYIPTYNSFADNSDLDYWRHAGSFYAWKEVKRNTRLELRNTYLRTNDPTDETGAIDPDDPLLGSAIDADLNRRGRNEFYTNAVEARVTHQFGTNDSFYLAYVYSIRREVDTIPGVVADDNDIQTASGGIDYNFTNRWTVQLDGYRQDEEYDAQSDRIEYNGNVRLLYNFDRNLSGFVAYRHTALDFDEDTEDDYNIYQPTVGIEKRFQNNARISIGVGYYWQDFDNLDDDSSPIAEAEVFKQWDYRRSYFNVLGTSGYDIDDGGVQDNGLRIYYDGRIEFGYRFTPRVSTTLFASYRYDEFPNAVPDRVDNTSIGGAAIEWQVLQWLIAELAYNYTDVTSDLDEQEYTENNVLLTITIAPSSPFRLN